jgi:hypothetical protein
MTRITAKEARERTNYANTDEVVLEFALDLIHNRIGEATKLKNGHSSISFNLERNFRFNKIWRKIKEALEKDGYTVTYSEVLWKFIIKW